MYNFTVMKPIRPNSLYMIIVNKVYKKLENKNYTDDLLNLVNTRCNMKITCPDKIS